MHYHKNKEEMKKKERIRKRNYTKFDIRTSFHRQLLVCFFSKSFALKQTEPQVNRKHSPNIMSSCVNRLVSWDVLVYFGNQFIQTNNV